VHHVTQKDPGRYPERNRPTLDAGFHQRSSRILRFIIHELNLTYTLPGKNKKFLTSLLLTIPNVPALSPPHAQFICHDPGGR
jgi:hypothetical protein